MIPKLKHTPWSDWIYIPNPDELWEELQVQVYHYNVDKWLIRKLCDSRWLYYHRPIGESYSLWSEQIQQASQYDSYKRAVEDLLTRDIKE